MSRGIEHDARVDRREVAISFTIEQISCSAHVEEDVLATLREIGRDCGSSQDQSQQSRAFLLRSGLVANQAAIRSITSSIFSRRRYPITSGSILANQSSTWLRQDEAMMGRAGHFDRPFAQFTTSVIGTTSAR